jgi:iron(III) transport system ATP-binding protein
MEVEDGEIVCLLGESGSGKSTILRIISGLEKSSKGTVIINDSIHQNKNIFVLPEKRNIGMVFQDYALFPHMSVEKNILFGMKIKDKKEKKKKLFQISKMVGIEKLLKRSPHNLSGGQQQRVAFARALASDPKVILLDEPFSNLDTNLKQNIRRDLKDIIKKSNIPTILVSHDKNDAYDLADKIVILKNGEIEQIGEKKDIFNSPTNEYVKQLLA